MEGAPRTAAVATELTITQSFDAGPQALVVGAALTRMVVTTATGLAAMLIPSPVAAPVAGVRLYVHDPVVADLKSPQGDVTGGRRTDAGTYVFETPGAYSLPAIAIDWTDPASAQSREATAPAVPVIVAPPSVAAQTAAQPGNTPLATDAMQDAAALDTPAARGATWRMLLLAAGVVLAVAGM